MAARTHIRESLMIQYLDRALMAVWWAIYDVTAVAWRIIFAAVYRRKWPY